MIIINGIPGSGKTTLARRLSQDLGLRMIGQDALKEFCADQLGGQFTPEKSSGLGRVTRRAVLEIGKELSSLGERVIIEGAFHALEAEKLIAEQMKDLPILQIYITGDINDIKQRFQARRGTADRHSVHADDTFDIYTDEQVLEKYRPLAGESIKTVIIDASGDMNDAYQQTREVIEGEL